MAFIINGLTRACHAAKTQYGIQAGLILCFLRHLSEDEAIETLHQALPYRNALLGVGLDSSELGYPPERFARVFALAREHGLHCVAHAGEEGPASYIQNAIEYLKVERIDHGVQAIHDAALMQSLAASQCPLTLCPLSNIKLKVFESLQALPFRALQAANLCLTINSDDPAYFGGYLNDNLTALCEAHDLSVRDVAQLIRNGFQASFLGPDEKQYWLQLVDTHFETMMGHRHAMSDVLLASQTPP